ncbi:MAG TPA: hypothetical protein VE198_09840, partial [Actinoallomurus sp.]|nr:hypothetical protein [Actinoallomurus sp.]
DMARRLVLTVSMAVAVALVAVAWATGGLRAVPEPEPRKPARSINLGRYAVVVTGALLHRESGGPVTLDVTLRVTDQDSRSTLVQDLAVNALALDVADGPAVKPISATGYSQGVDVNMLHPGVPAKVVLIYGLASAAVPSGFHARMVFWGYDHREDFFYGHRQWKPRKPADAKDDDAGEYAVPLTIRRQGI